MKLHTITETATTGLNKHDFTHHSIAAKNEFLTPETPKENNYLVGIHSDDKNEQTDPENGWTIQATSIDNAAKTFRTEYTHYTNHTLIIVQIDDNYQMCSDTIFINP